MTIRILVERGLATKKAGAAQALGSFLMSLASSSSEICLRITYTWLGAQRIGGLWAGGPKV